MFLVFCFLFALTYAQPSDPQLLEERLHNTKLWIERANSFAQMNYAFNSGEVVSNNVGHGVVGIGYYKPKDAAYEYDSLVFALEVLIGFNPVILQPRFDRYSITWNGTDRLIVDYFATIKTGFNPSTGVYDIIAEGIRYREYMKFVPGTKFIDDGLTFPEPAETKIFETQTSSFSPEAVCYGFVGPACLNTPYWSDTEFSSLVDCVQFLYALGPDSESKSPYTNSANTTGCRQFHGTLALIDPAVHCSHTAKNSHKCHDASMGVCDSCHQFAECTGDVSTETFQTTFGCKCKPGYKGDGFNSCVAQNCSATWQCQMDAGTGGCSSGICKCADTFVWNPATGKCDCPAPSTKFWADGHPTCHRLGRCDYDWQCPQKANEIKCRSVGFNPYVEKACLCNRGFNGGVERQCVCDGGRAVWSAIDNGNVCIKGNECTVNWHCPNNGLCVGATSTEFGHCE